MSKYITKANAKLQIQQVCFGLCLDDETEKALVSAIDEMPSADVVEVVRCKDCKHCEKIDEYEFWCKGRGYPEIMVRPYDFCSSEERKETDVLGERSY